MNHIPIGTFSVGQIIVGRGLNRYNKDDIVKFVVTKVGRKYIYVKNDSGYLDITLDKRDLVEKDYSGNWEFFISEKAMKEHDEKVKLIWEIKDRMSRLYRLDWIGLEELRQIRRLLERKDPL